MRNWGEIRAKTDMTLNLRLKLSGKKAVFYTSGNGSDVLAQPESSDGGEVKSSIPFLRPRPPRLSAACSGSQKIGREKKLLPRCAAVSALYWRCSNRGTSGSNLILDTRV